MFELGSESTSEHTNLVQFCQNQPHITFHFIVKVNFTKVKLKHQTCAFMRNLKLFQKL